MRDRRPRLESARGSRGGVPTEAGPASRQSSRFACGRSPTPTAMSPFAQRGERVFVRPIVAEIQDRDGLVVRRVRPSTGSTPWRVPCSSRRPAGARALSAPVCVFSTCASSCGWAMRLELLERALGELRRRQCACDTSARTSCPRGTAPDTRPARAGPSRESRRGSARRRRAPRW